MDLKGRHIVLGVTGGIAAYKACELTSRLRKAGADVHVIMTKNACNFVQPQSFQTLSGNPVCTDTFAVPVSWEVEHVALAKAADLFVIAPATANMMGKLAAGIADDMLSTTVMATHAPVLIAPAMNTGMWENAATQHNLEVLKERGYLFIGPEGGFLACGDNGTGRMSEPESIFNECARILSRGKDLAGVRILVTAGPTREQIDPVRFITNRSTGKMGYAIAEAAVLRGADVTLVSGPVSIPSPNGVTLESVTDTASLCEKMTALCPEQDIVIQSAAPADFTPVSFSESKIKKDSSGMLTITFRQTQDVAKTIGMNKRKGQTFIGFAAETDDVLENAVKKLKSKNLDMIVANDIKKPGAGFGTDTNIVTFITENGTEDLPLMSKRDVAERILDKVLSLRMKNGC